LFALMRASAVARTGFEPVISALRGRIRQLPHLGFFGNVAGQKPFLSKQR
jgi:hypothetical protein